MTETTKSTTTATEESATGIVVIDLGRRTRAEIRDLRKGEGKLFDEVDRIAGQLKTDRIKGHPVFVVEEKRKRGLLDL